MTTDLQDILSDIRACRACAGVLAHTPRPVVRVFPETQLLICGQAPGRRVHESGLPFTDPSGDRLRDWMGVDYETFYADHRIGVAAQAFCYPGTAPKGGDYPPPTRCADLWRPQLLEALPRMSLTLLVGGYAQAWALGKKLFLGVPKKNHPELMRPSLFPWVDGQIDDLPIYPWGSPNR